MIYVFWNKLANNGKAAEAKAELENVFSGEFFLKKSYEYSLKKEYFL